MLNLNEKYCSKCNKIKDQTLFHKDNARRDGRNSYCKECKQKHSTKSRQQYKERYAAYEFQRSLKRHYGMTLEQYELMFKEQDGKCACCGIDEGSFKNRFHVDHNHKTGEIRGLLCTQCNPGIGYFKDSVERLKQAIAYLEKFKK